MGGDLLNASLQAVGELPLEPCQAAMFEVYLALLVKWNSKVSLTAVRDTEGIVQRHFVESIFCARNLPSSALTMLDFGSGAGFPGLPCGILLPNLKVTLAESQKRKAAFLSEVVRSLNLSNVSVHAERVERLPEVAAYDVVALRAVDHMGQACQAASVRVAPRGCLAVLTTSDKHAELAGSLREFCWLDPIRLPASACQTLLFGRRP